MCRHWRRWNAQYIFASWNNCNMEGGGSSVNQITEFSQRERERTDKRPTALIQFGRHAVSVACIAQKKNNTLWFWTACVEVTAFHGGTIKCTELQPQLKSISSQSGLPRIHPCWGWLLSFFSCEYPAQTLLIKSLLSITESQKPRWLTNCGKICQFSQNSYTYFQ